MLALFDRVINNLKTSASGSRRIKCQSFFSTSIKIMPSIMSVDTNSSDYSYWSEIYEKQEPIVFKGLLSQNSKSQWPALSPSLSDRFWSLENLKKRCGGEMVTVEAFGDYMDPKMEQVDIYFEDFVSFIESKGSMHMYLAQQDLEAVHHSLVQDIIEPAICKTGKGVLYRRNIWLGPGNIASPCHYDPFQNMLCQVIGRKRVIVFAPTSSNTQSLYPCVGTLQMNTSSVDISNPNLIKFPLFKNAIGLECILEPGDALFIPLKHWHYCKSLEASCSVNFWWL